MAGLFPIVTNTLNKEVDGRVGGHSNKYLEYGGRRLGWLP